MDGEKKNVIDRRGTEKQKKELPDWLQKIKSIKHIEIIIAIIVIVVVVIAYTYTVNGSKTSNEAVAEGETLTAELTAILSKIDGVGKVDILIIYNGGKQLEIASEVDKNTDIDSEGDRTTTTIKENQTPVIVDGNKPLVIGEKRAQIDGVIIVAEGGGDNNVRVQLMRAISSLLKIDFKDVQVFKAK